MDTFALGTGNRPKQNKIHCFETELLPSARYYQVRARSIRTGPMPIFLACISYTAVLCPLEFTQRSRASPIDGTISANIGAKKGVGGGMQADCSPPTHPKSKCKEKKIRLADTMTSKFGGNLRSNHQPLKSADV